MEWPSTPVFTMLGWVSEADPALFRAFPALADVVPWLPLGRFPTRVERLSGLVPPSVELWIKRDDESGTVYGGNKVRKLEFLLADARLKGARRLVTLGGIGSHHVLATAIYGRAAGFEVDAVVFPQPLNDHVREQLLADSAVGATLWPTRGYLGVPWTVWRRRRAADAAWVASGGSSPVGTIGYVSAGLELLEQIARAELPRPDVIYLALGSCGTAAGLLTGLAGAPSLPRLDATLVGVRVVDRPVSNARVTRRLAARTAALLAGHGEKWFNHLALPPLRVEHRFFGGAYGRATPAAEEAVERAAFVGLRLEPTYTGKAMAALLADAAAGLLDGKRVLFVHTYNGVDLAPLVRKGVGASALPPRLRRHFDAGALPPGR
ncbi:MAG: 1-aminocyclopropane-carboxylate deaminase [Myxococcales bacterium]|nr:1-aminocyclopropane-carboxylate deaminase [Myxococcales bacterium]